MTNHTDAENEALGDFIQEYTEKFMQELLDRNLCVGCAYGRVLQSMVSTVVYNGNLDPQSVYNLVVNSIQIGIDGFGDGVEKNVLHAKRKS